MFCALSQNYQHIFEKLSEKLKNGIKTFVGCKQFLSYIIDYKDFLLLLINNSRTMWPTEI